MNTAKRAKAPTTTTATSTPKTAPRAVKTAAPRTARRPKTAAGPSYEAIAARAYEIYLGRNGAPGDPNADWLQAEQELAATGAPKSRRRTSATA